MLGEGHIKQYSILDIHMEKGVLHPYNKERQ